MPRYKCKSIAALQIALGGLPDKMRVEVDPNIRVSAKTVGELRKMTAWSENLAITTPQERHPESAVKVSKAAAAPLIQITAHPAYASACWRANGVMRSAVMRFFSRRSTRKRKPWKVKFCPGSGIDCAS
jgi:hypothetical protein